MTTTVTRRDRIGQFVDLARAYRGWTSSELGAALGRDPSKVIPESGNPKLDLVIALASALDWQVGEVAEAIWKDDQNSMNSEGNTGSNPGLTLAGVSSFDELNEQSRQAHRSGDWKGLLTIGGGMLQVATSADQRALAHNRVHGGYDGLGRYADALRAAQAGLKESGATTTLRVMLQANLANSYYNLWHLIEAHSVASDLIERLDRYSTMSKPDSVMFALARYVRGHALRRQLADAPDDIAHLGSRARADLQASQEMYEEYASTYGDASYLGVANTCHAGLLEVDAATGLIDPIEAIQEIEAGLENIIDVRTAPQGDMLESWGWWAILGCNICLRHLSGDPMHHHMAIFTNKAIEVGEQLNNWAMRERAFTLEHFRRQQARIDGVQDEATWGLDDEEIKVVTGTMGRFPAFREIGWRILRSAQVLEAS